MSDLKPYTMYRCPTQGCGSSRWTGALSTPERPHDHLCMACGEPWVEVVKGGHTYRVSWEMIGPYGKDWCPASADHDDRHAAEDQYRTLSRWERTGEGPVRGVKIERSAVPFTP